MAPKMGKSKLRDFDPESILDPAPSSSDENDHSGSESEEDTQAGREHYADVGKSKLRKKEVVPLGPQYTGSRIDRDALEDEDSDDPFARSYDVEDSEKESEDGAKIVNGNGVAHGDGSEEEDEEAFDEDEDAESDDEMVDGDSDGLEDEDDENEDDEDDEDDEDEDDEDAADQTAKLREMMKDTSIVTSTISAAQQSDIEKGKAIKSQRKTFDTLLNTRVKLSKALISTNSMAADIYVKSDAPDSAIEAAETAALNLLKNLTDLRSSLEEARGVKRKRQPSFSSSTPSSEIWSHIRESESTALPQRNTILERWSAKTKGTSLSSGRGRLNAGAEQTLTDVLRSQLQDSSRLVGQTQVPRSCAPLQVGKISSSEAIYDDSPFYSLLLKELLENRSNELNANGTAEFIVEANPWQLTREAKTKKIVDTKASKGRKLRYTVHEKLQNYMAPENRSTWQESAVQDLFGGLFGRRIRLGEDEDVKSDEDEVDAEEEGLMLFRS